MSGINVARLKQLVSNFSEELAGILDEEGLNTASKKNWKEEADRSIEDLETATSTLSSKTKGELILLSHVAEEVSSSLMHGCESRLDVENVDKFYGEEVTVPVIVVRGPPGTEPVLVNNTPFKGRYDDMESVVYSRISSSSGAGLSNGHTPSPSQVLSIPSKDIPKLRAEVYATPTRSRRVLRSQRTLPPSLSSGPPSPSLSSQSSQPSEESSYSPTIEASSTTNGRVRRSRRIREHSEDSEVTPMSHENSPSMLTGQRHLHTNEMPPEGDDNMSHKHADDSDDASPDHMDESQGTTTSTGLTPKAGSATPEDIVSPSLSPLPYTTTTTTTTVPETVPETPTPTRVSFLRRNGSKDLLSMSTEEYFSAQEDIGEGATGKFDKHYNADLGGSIRSDSVEDVIATNIAVKTDDDDDGFFMGQASTDDSDIEQTSYSAPKELETQEERKINSSRLSPVPPDGIVRVEGSRKVQRKGRQERGSIKLPPLSSSTTPPLSIKSVLDREVKVVVPKLSHKSLSQELSKFKSPGLGESPLSQAATAATPEQKLSDSECLDEEMASQQVDVEVPDMHVPEATPPEGSGGEDNTQRGRKSKLKRRKGKPRAEFKVKTEPLSQRFVEDSSSGGSGTGIRASSSPDDITFSDVAYNAIGDSPPVGSEPPSESSAKLPCSDDLGSSSNGDSRPGSSLKPKRHSPLKHSKRGSTSSHSRSRSSSVTSNPRTPLFSQLHGEDEDFDTKSPFFRPSRGSQHATPTPKKATPLKKKKKVLVTISSDEEDEKPLVLSSKKGRKVKKEKGVEGSSQDMGESAGKKFLDFGADGDIFTFDSDDDGMALGGTGRRGKVRVREKIEDWIEHLDEDGNIGSGEGPSSGLKALEEDDSLASDFDAGMGTSTPKKERGRSKSNGLLGREGGSSSVDRKKIGNHSCEGTPSSLKPVAADRVQRSSASPGRSPLEVNIALKSPLKLGKHAKGPHNKGKEKAQPLPRTIQCLACGKAINWRIQKVHAHPRLNVITCQRCYNVWTTGHFHKFEMDENEIYCSLCGDGGEIVLCDHCDKSFCYTCITRISGKEHLHYLLDEENAKFCCYMCDSSPIKDMQEMCVELTGYFKKSKGGRVGLRSRHGIRGGVVIGGGGGGVVDGGTGSGTDSGNSVRENGGGISKGGEGGGENGGSGGGGGGDGGQKRPQKKRAGSFGGFSDSSSHSDEGDSPEIFTDDVGLSDSSLPRELEEGRAKHNRLKRLRKRANRDNSSAGSERKQNDTEKDEDEEEDKEGAKKKRRRRRSFGDYGSSLSEEEEEEDGGEESSGSMKVRRKVKRKFSTDSSDAEGKVRASHKKSRLAASLSSGSEDNYDALALQLSPSNIMSTSDHGSRQVTPTKGGGGNSVKYRIMKPHGLDSSSDDSEPRVLQRKRRKADVGSGEGGAVSGEEKDEKVERKTKRRGRKKKADFSSDEDDFIGKTLTVRGAYGHRRKKIGRILSSDSGDSAEEIEVKAEQSDTKKEEEEGEDELNTSFTGKKRKKIRKVLGDTKLASETKQAKEAERERMERLKKRKAQGKSGDREEEEERLVLERDPESKAIILEVRQSLVPHMKSHQREGVEFLYEACVESMKRLSSGKAGGAILAHCMGLGKTLQVIAFADALLNCAESGVKKVLILCPVNTVNNWKVEFFKWISFRDCDYNVHILSESTARTRLNWLRRWFQSGGIIFMGYEMFRNLALSKRGKKKTREEFCKYLLDPGADMVVCDEGHVMRNSKSSLSLVVNRVKTRLRVVLTGTPLQNNLVEYHTMVHFVKPNLLGNPREFKNQFVNPITNGQCRDSSPHDIRTMKHRAHVLFGLLKDTVQRRDFRILAKTLPPKKEYVLNMRLSSVQDQLYRRYLNKSGSTYMASDLFSTFSALAKVWNHPWVLKLDEQRKLEKAEREALLRSDEEEEEDETLGGFIVLSDSEEESSNSRSTSRSASITEKSVSKSGSGAGPVVISSDEEDLPKISVKSEPMPKESTPVESEASSAKSTDPPQPSSLHSKSPPPWYDDLVGEGCEEQMDLSGKLLFLFELLEQTRTLKEKVLVFSQSLLTLDLIEEFLSKPQFGDWVPALDYYRLDGSTSADIRTANMASFNKDGNDRLRLFLISTRAGSLGVNLVAANRVVIFDACWNPSHDLQAIFRAYRYGQTKPVFVYRLLAKGTMEEKIYDRQVTKQSLSMRVVDERQIGRHYSSSDLAELFTYTPPPPPDQANSDKPPSKPEEDLVLCRILEKMQPSWVISYHEHDSLLEHIDDEELSEEERKAAWANYNQQMSVESARYNLQALQERLEETGQGTPFPGGGGGGAMATTNQHNLALLSQNPVAVFEEFKKQSDLTVSHVRNLKSTSSTLNLLRQRFPNAQVTPRAVQDQIYALDHQKRMGYEILGAKVKKVNELMMACRSSPLSTNALYMGIMDRQRLTLYNELEMLRQLPPLSVATPILSTGGTLPATSVTIQQNPGGGVAPSANHPHPHPQVMGAERTAVTSRPRNQPTPPLGGHPSNHTRQGLPSSSAAVSRSTDEVSSTTK